jgi:hypothetical protein
MLGLSGRKSGWSKSDMSVIEQFAATHRLKIRIDREYGTEIIPGKNSATPTADFPSTRSVSSIKPLLGFVQVFKEQFLVCARGHDFQGLTVNLMQHSSVVPVIEDKPVPLSDEFRQFFMALYFSHGRAIIKGKLQVCRGRVHGTTYPANHEKASSATSLETALPEGCPRLSAKQMPSESTR